MILNEKHNTHFKVVNTIAGEQLILALKLKQEFKDKSYNLYTVYKVVNGEYIELYNETFTEKQLNLFYNYPTYYLPGTNDE